MVPPPKLFAKLSADGDIALDLVVKQQLFMWNLRASFQACLVRVQRRTLRHSSSCWTSAVPRMNTVLGFEPTQDRDLWPVQKNSTENKLAHRHTVRRGKPHPATSEANRSEASLAPAPALCSSCGGSNPGCGGAMDPYGRGPHELVIPRSAVK